MKDFPVAIQLYSLREDITRDFYGTLKKVKEMGYDGVEFAGLADKNADEVKAWCEELDLTPISAHIPFVDMLKNPENHAGFLIYSTESEFPKESEDLLAVYQVTENGAVRLHHTHTRNIPLRRFEL